MTFTLHVGHGTESRDIPFSEMRRTVVVRLPEYLVRDAARKAGKARTVMVVLWEALDPEVIEALENTSPGSCLLWRRNRGRSALLVGEDNHPDASNSPARSRGGVTHGRKVCPRSTGEGARAPGKTRPRGS